MIFDLHVHTTYSDGLLTPKEVIDLSIKKRLDGIAITDHDTIDGIKPAIDYNNSIEGIHIIPGIEFSCVYKDEDVHILGYFIDYKSKEIIQLTKILKENRITRGIKMIQKINELGMNLGIDEVKNLSKDNYIGRPHIARALVNRGYVQSINEAFENYLNRGKPGYVKKESLSIIETIKIIKKLSGISVLAHPGLLKNKMIINDCINMGIQGLETIHSKHSSKDIKYLLDISEKNNLFITGGSDCHGELINGEYLLGKYYINIDHIPILKGRI